jgi:SAM-dependent methyltransferase
MIGGRHWGREQRMTSEAAWHAESENWVRWARAPGHDAYWYYRDAFFDVIVPAPGRRTIEVGCGEGRVARDLAARGHDVVGVDASPAMVAHARQADPGGGYLVADAARLPFPDACADLVVAYNSLMDVSDMPAAVAEAARVLEPGGRLCVCITHPMSEAGNFAGNQAPDAPFVIDADYLSRRRIRETYERDGLRVTFSSHCYPLEGYTRALEAAGLLIEALREPPAPATAVAARPGFARWRRIPGFLHVRAVKPAAAPHPPGSR